VILEHGPGRLLDLQEQWVLGVAALQQHDERPGAGTAHANHFARQIDDLKPLEQVAPIVLQRATVVPELVAQHLGDIGFVHPVLLLEVTNGYHYRRLAGDPVLSVDQFAELGQGLQAIPGLCFPEVLVRLLGRPGDASGRGLFASLAALAGFGVLADLRILLLPAFPFFPVLDPMAAFVPPLPSAASLPSAPCISVADLRAYHSSMVPIWAN